MSRMGEHLEQNQKQKQGRGGGGGVAENSKTKKQSKTKLAEDIIKAVKSENFGFSDQQLRPAVNKLIEIYGTDDAYTWITEDNFAVLVNFLLESPHKATDGSSSPRPLRENVHGKPHSGQIPVRHSGNEFGATPLARNVTEQGCLYSTTSSLSNEPQKKRCREGYATDGSSKAKKMKLYSNSPDVKPHAKDTHKRFLEHDNGVSSAPSPAMSGEKEIYTSKKMNRSRQMHESVGSLNCNASNDNKTSYQERKEDFKISKSYSNAAKECNAINPRRSVVPPVKEKEFSRHKSMHEEDDAFVKQTSPTRMREKQFGVMNSRNGDEGHRMSPRDLRNYSQRQTGKLKITLKECSAGKVGHQNELGQDNRIKNENKRKSIVEQTSSSKELSKTSKEQCSRKVKDHKESVVPVTEREFSKQKSVHTEGDSVKTMISITDADGEQNSFTNCKNVNDENKTSCRDQRKSVNNKQKTPSKQFTISSKEHNVWKVEGLNEEVLLSDRKTNNIISLGSNKSNKKNAIMLANLSSPQKTKNALDHLNIEDSPHGKEERIEKRVSDQFSSSFLKELKIAASRCVKTTDGWLKSDMSLEALQFFLDWKRSLQWRKGKAVAYLNDNRQDNCLHKQEISKNGEVARVRKNKLMTLSNQAEVDGNLLSLDISRGLERKKITCVNEHDDSFFPEDFVYITKSVITADAHVDLSISRIGDMHCSCFGDCLMLTTPCKCTDDTRGEYAYDKDGLLIPRLATNYCFQEGKMTRADFITECTPICPCDMQCGNRVVQRGLTYRLQVFMTKEGKGWGVRTLERIVARSFLFEYIGEIMTNMEQYYRNEEYKNKKIHTYQMYLDADYDMETKHFKEGLNDNEALTLDATLYGNVSRFVNHRCGDPNMFIRPVQIETRDTHYYHVAFFASHDIAEMEELTWDYGINFSDSHEVKGFRCLCGSNICRDSKKKSH